jgi:para-aminobenzoate synthetase component 1
MLQWSTGFNPCCYLDSNQYADRYGRFAAVLAAGALRSVCAEGAGAWESLHGFRQQARDWIFGHFSYDLKGEHHRSTCPYDDHTGFADLFFFQPEVLLLLGAHEVEIGLVSATPEDARHIFQSICGTKPSVAPVQKPRTLSWQTPMNASQYVAAVRALQDHLQRGNAYEVNFCREFFCRAPALIPQLLFRHLNDLSPAPFAACYHVGDSALVCSSPERFLQKSGTRVISQPIKGTARRSQDAAQDALLKRQLYASAKEQSENIMAVDLVRNDLSRTAIPGTVKIEELFGIYSFAQVHQMITTVSAQVPASTAAEAILYHAFPMASMTGAPKHRVIQLIDTYERSRRSIFSGALGYFSPEGDFDFNVVIRSLVYHAAEDYLSFQTGSGITIYSDPDRELEECLLKARAMQQAVAQGWS